VRLKRLDTRSRKLAARSISKTGAQRLDYKVSEHYRQVQIQLSDEERRRSWNPAVATRTDLVATGELGFEINDLDL
jgi:hypothetical protein